MAKYHPHYPTIVSADPSSHSLGVLLLQDQPSGIRQVYASRSLTPTEGRYSQTETESLAVTWAVSRFDQYLRSLSFEVESDRLLLVALLSSKDLEVLPPQAQQMQMKLMHYQYTVKYVPEKLLALVDKLSRAPCDSLPSKANNDLEIYVGEVLKELLPLVASRLDNVHCLQAQDGVCFLLVTCCEGGWPSNCNQEQSTNPHNTVLER